MQHDMNHYLTHLFSFPSSCREPPSCTATSSPIDGRTTIFPNLSEKSGQGKPKHEAVSGSRDFLVAKPQPTTGWYARLAPIQVLSLLKSTPIIFPLLMRTRLLIRRSRWSQTNIIRISALAGMSGVWTAGAYSTL